MRLEFWAGLAIVASALPAVSGAPVCRVRSVALENPPPLVTTAVASGEELLLAGGANGLQRVDLQTGRQLAMVPVRGAGFDEGVPMYLASGTSGVAISGANHRWCFLDASYRIAETLSHAMVDPLGSCLLFDDRIVVYGFAREEKTGGPHAWLFVQYRNGGVLPLAEYDRRAPLKRHLGEFHLRQITQGGVCRRPGGGWVAVDPLDYTVRVFDLRDRQVGGFTGQNRNFRRPDVGAYPDGAWSPGDRSAYFGWLQAQCQVKRPVALSEDIIGIVVGIPMAQGRQRHELDVYHVDGTPLATSVPIPGLEVGRLVVVDAEPGRLVLVTQERSWPFGAPARVWEVDVSGLDAPTATRAGRQK